MKTGNTNYEKVTKIETAKEVEENLTNKKDWYYRAWHRRTQTILNACEEVQRLPDIK